MRSRIFSTLSVLVALLGFSGALISQISESVKPTLLKQPAAKPGKDADKTGIYGEVSVKVTVSSTGKVLSAEFLEGPGWTCPEVTNQAITSFRSAAREAAAKATFSPAMLNNEKVGSEAILKYLFQPPELSPATGLSMGGENDGARIFRVEGPTKVGDTATEQSNKDSQGVLTGTALALGKPIYPSAAKAVRAGGQVRMQVIIDTDGTILLAEPLSGHPLLRSSARTAACGSKFLPTLLSGKPVKVSGVIVYNFVP